MAVEELRTVSVGAERSSSAATLGSLPFPYVLPHGRGRIMSGIENPSHPVPQEVAAGIRAMREAEFAALARQDEIARVARPNADERRLAADVRHQAAQGREPSAGTTERLRELRAMKFNRVREAISRDAAVLTPIGLSPPDPRPPLPAPADPTFWWARTDWWLPGHVGANFASDGLHFSGGVSTHDGDLHTDSFGAVALFELQADRIPKSPSGRWLSTPHVELFGGALGYTGDADIFTGDLWSKCWVHRDQQLYQFGFGPNGPVPIIRGQAHESETLIFEEDGDRSVHTDLRGFQWMPPVTFGGISPADSLWARLEIRFDIQTEGAGSLLWLDPEVLLRTFQWPLTPL